MARRRLPVTIALATAYATLVLYALVILATDPGDGLNTFVSVWVYNALFVVSFAFALARAVLVRAERLAWSVVAASLAAWCFAELYYAIVAPEGYPSLADAGWLAFYPLVYVGMVLLVRERARSVAGALWLDGLTASLATAALGAAVLVEVVLRTDEQGSTASIATNLAYPLGDVLLLSAVFGVLSLAGWRLERRWVVLGLGVLATTVADAIYLFTLETYEEGAWFDPLWPASTLMIAAAGWLAVRDELDLRVEGRPLLVVPSVCVAVATGVLVYDHFDQVNLLAISLSVATLLLVVVRLGLTFRENARLYALTHRESMTDPLTGIGNRRKLLADLHELMADAAEAPTLLMVLDLNGFKGYNDQFGHPAGDALLARLGQKLAEAVPDGGSYRLGGDEFCVVAPVTSTDVETLVDRACSALTEHGEGFEVSASFGAVMLYEEATDASGALSLADERLYAQKQRRRPDGDATTYAFLEALAAGEREPSSEEQSVAALAIEVGRRLGLPAEDVSELARAARLHNLGKLAVPEEIVDKAGPLDAREWAFIRQHPIVGERILRASPELRSVASVVRSSHENWDGTGYPDRLEGEDIPLASRIVRACDAFCAMTATRPYRRALSVDEALAEIAREAGTAFDPSVADVLVSHVRERWSAERVA